MMANAVAFVFIAAWSIIGCLFALWIAENL